MSTREFPLPDLGEGLSEARVVRWLVAVGDTVVVDQSVAEVETAKALVDLPCPYPGTVDALHVTEGATAEVGSSLMTVRTAEAEPHWGPAGAGPGALGAGAGPVAVVSPVVRKAARDHGVDLASLVGSGPDGRIERVDVERAIARPSDGDEVIPVNQAAARKYLLGRSGTPHASCWLEADATELVQLKRELAIDSEKPVPLIALLARICTTALQRHPALNATVDDAQARITRHRAIGLGIAVQGARGLVVPVLRDAGDSTLAQLADGIARLVHDATTGVLTPAELTGGTFTLNNYGPLGVDGADPILNLPQAAMLGVARIAERPWAYQGGIALRRTVRLGVTFDHRVCDGEEAAAFLTDIAARVERPLRLLHDC
ncbi:dihydrolipoamide acetyltransferase family protein [Streptomyces sp. NBC_00059]|uniref:dihydrolipoamide acetyltransferase family protein n=1 Tax=Streptomyces sp. NBC_00059 TaxID=2975635 RepID=UPI002256C3E6|nr:dihydrolipoamide acetyltransferase family protein [Streptomyces sp. NBC_00059]MCX5415802.1 2-oxo acid dehydrogenase subunit E2 [Streptomyces sp. NBC_00059]